MSDGTKIMVLTLAEMLGVDPVKFAKKFVANVKEAKESGDSTYGDNKWANKWRDEGLKLAEKEAVDKQDSQEETLDKITELLEKLLK